VAEGARVKAKVTARTITIAGELDGEVVRQGVVQIMLTGQVLRKSQRDPSSCRRVASTTASSA
jgi:cytoskeletal protein CcmA (bactofilin family)